MKRDSFINSVFQGLIVSCQALENEPLFGAEIMGKMALAAKEGGARAIRANTVEDIMEIKKVTGLPVVGLIKRDYPDSEIYITPTLREVKELVETKCEVIALDATNRSRPNGESLKTLVQYIHENSDALVMGDIATEEDAYYAVECGVDMVSTTLSGYTADSPKMEGPDFALVEKLVQTVKVPVIAEGRITTPEQAAKMIRLGAHAVVVGGAITRPQLITKRFTEYLNQVTDVER